MEENQIKWQVLFTKIIPLIPTAFFYWLSYRLSKSKSVEGEKQNEFKRLNEENTRLEKRLAETQKLVEDKNDEIYKLHNRISKMMADLPAKKDKENEHDS